MNEEISRLRHAATNALLTRNDVLIVASVSCIYGLGNHKTYQALAERLVVGQAKPRGAMISNLTNIHYRRNDVELRRGTFPDPR